jgi:MFS family permease
MQFNAYRSLLHNKKFFSFWLGYVFSSIGDTVTRVALTWFVFEQTKSPRALGLLTIAYTAPILIGGFLAGPLLDRFTARRVMVFDSLIRGVAFALLPVLYALHLLQVWHVYIFAVLYGFMMMISFAGGPTLIPALVKADQLETANAMELLVFTLSGVIGSPLAGLLIVLMGSINVVILDVLSYLVFALVLLRIQVLPDQHITATSNNLFFSIQDAAQVMISNKPIFLTTLMFICYNIGDGIMMVYLPLLSDLMAPNSPGVYGFLIGATTLGGVISAGLAGSLVSKTTLGTRIALVQALAGVALLFLTGLGPGFVFSGLFLYGFFATARPIWAQTLRMQIIPTEMRGRVFALLRTLMRGATPLGGVLAGFLIPVMGIPIMIIASALIVGLPGVVGMQIRELRQAGSSQ